jgi:peptidyl-prolyl cis-trans isomerase SurA
MRNRRGRKREEALTEPGSRGDMNRDRGTIARILAVTLLLAGGLILAAALPAHGQTPQAKQASAGPAAIGGNGMSALSRPVARVNGTVLTERDLLREMYAIFPYARQHNGGFPKVMEADIRRGALKMIEFEELVYQEAKRRGMTIAPARLAKAEKDFRGQFPSEEKFREYLLAEAGGSLEVLRTKIARSLLIDDLLREEVTSKSAVSREAAKAYYQAHLERFRLPETYAMQSITVMPPVQPTAKQPVPPQPTMVQWVQMKARAEEALRQAKATKNYEEFGILAEKISEDDYRVMMGDHRSVEAKDVPPAILQVIAKMQPGQISDVIEVEGALTIIRLNAHTPTRMQKFEEVDNGLRAELQRNKQEMLRRELDAKLRKHAKVEDL